MLNLWATNPSPTSRLTTLNPSEKPSTIQWERPSPNPTESTNKPENENERESNISENNNTNKPESDNNPQTDISDSDNDMSDGDDKQQIQRLEITVDYNDFRQITPMQHRLNKQSDCKAINDDNNNIDLELDDHAPPTNTIPRDTNTVPTPSAPR